MIYADNAATTPLDPDAFESMKPFLLNQYGNASQPYSFAREPRKALNWARETIAECIGAQPNEIYFTSGGTESDNWAVKSCSLYGRGRPILASSIEHHAILNTCAAMEKLGTKVYYLPVDSEGVVNFDCLGKYLENLPGLVSIMLANNEIGTIEPLSDFADSIHAKGALFHTDAVQAVGHIPIDIKHLGVDMLSASAHKFNGPKGVGFLFVKSGVQLSPFMDGGAQETGMRAGTENIAGIVGMATALKKNCTELPTNQKRLIQIQKAFLDVLSEANIDFVLNGSVSRIPGNVSVSFRGASGEMLLHRLDLKKIYISTGSACDSKNVQISHVLKAIHLPDEYAKGTIRVSFGKQNTVEEAIALANTIVSVLQKKSHER